MINLGDVSAGATIQVPWSSNGADGASITRATDGSIRVYKDNSTTQRSSSAGITDSEDFDGITGVHLVNIDLSNNTDAGFYAAGHNYHVMLVAASIDGKTVNSWLATFSIENRGGAAPSAEEIADMVATRGSANWENDVEVGSIGENAIEATHRSDTTTNVGYVTIYAADGVTPLFKRLLATNTSAEPLTGVAQRESA